MPRWGVLPYICLIGNVCAAPKGMPRLFGLKTAGKGFAYFRLNSGNYYVFPGTEYGSECMNVFVVLSPNE